MSILNKLYDNKNISPQAFVVENSQYETIMGSYAYGVSSDNSDIDIYGFTIPPKDMVFPHLKGEIMGFGKQIQRFEQYSEHHIPFNDKIYDISMYNIVKYFHLCMQNNPNMIDSMFTPVNCVLKRTVIGEWYTITADYSFIKVRGTSSRDMLIPR